VRIGIHVRGFEGGRPVAVQRALDRGAETIQIFASNPRQWRTPAIDPEADRILAREMADSDVGPLFLHAPYLVNLASPTAATREQSRRMVDWTMERASQVGAVGVVVHAGQSVGGNRVQALREVSRALCGVLGSEERGPHLLLELTAGSAGAIASRVNEAAEVLDACDGHGRLGICVDTCHLHAAGVDLSMPQGIEDLVEELDSAVGIDRLGLIHTNDSKYPVGSHRDRHWHIGQGEIGLDGFRALVRNPALAGIPMICETPGKLVEDRRNIQTLKDIRAAVLEGNTGAP
jgi:deoxyribonuclease-4